MQKQSTTTSNLQVKLITDARKLLEKVRSQQVLSADSSFDSSFLFDPIQDPKEIGIVFKKSSDDDQQHKQMSSPPLNLTIEDLDLLAGSSASSSFRSGMDHRAMNNISPISKPNEPNKVKNTTNTNTSSIRNPPQTVIPDNFDIALEDDFKQDALDARPQSSPEESSVEKLQEENMKLKRENYQLNEEMNDFEYKLYCLEHTLGIIEDVEKSSKDMDHGKRDNQQDAGMPSISENNELNNFKPLPQDQANDRLSPITAMVANAVIAGAGVEGVEEMDLMNSTLSHSGRDGPPQTPFSKSQEEEIRVLRENNEKMVTAIKALAQATIAQTRKHYLYKKRHRMTKQMAMEESEKLSQLMIEKEKVQSEFFETRANFLKERDIKEELSTEIQLMAKKNNQLRKEKQRHEDTRIRILDRVEFRDDAATVLSRISDSSCFPILQTITESGPTSKMGRTQQRSSKDKNVEKLIFKLISQLRKRDTKIEKLQKKLKITMSYLQEALELEVARQDAEIAFKQNGSDSTGKIISDGGKEIIGI